MSAPIRLAFLGLDHPHGAGWRKIVRGLAPEAEITCLVTSFGGARASLEECHAHCPRFETTAELLEHAHLFDAAMVCLPNDECPQAVVDLAGRGKHVLVEKPGAASAEDALRMARAVEEAGVAYQSGYMWRYDPGSDRMRAMIADGRFGKLISVEMTFLTSNVARRGPEHYLFDRRRSGRGFFNWLACHFLDLLGWITGERVVGVTARVGRYGHVPVDMEDGGAALLDLSGGGLATFVGGYWFPRWSGESRISVMGRDRWVHWDTARPGTGGVIEIHGPQPQWDAMEEVFTLPEDKTPGYGGQRNRALVANWFNDIQSGRRTCRNTPRSAVTVMKLIDAIYESSETGRRVEVSPTE